MQFFKKNKFVYCKICKKNRVIFDKILHSIKFRQKLKTNQKVDLLIIQSINLK